MTSEQNCQVVLHCFGVLSNGHRYRHVRWLVGWLSAKEVCPRTAQNVNEALGGLDHVSLMKLQNS